MLADVQLTAIPNRRPPYEPAYGRFLQPDPIGYDSGPNLYAYVRNDPINWIDPLGLGSCPIGSKDVSGGVREENGVIVVPATKCIRMPGDGGGGNDGRAGGLGGPRTGNGRGADDDSENDEQCPVPPSERPVGSREVTVAGLLDPVGMLIAYEVRSLAHQATAERYGRSGTDNESDAFRHFYGSFALGRLIGPARAFSILNANEVQRGYSRSTSLDTFNNWIGVTLSQDPSLSGQPTAEIAERLLENGCLQTSP